MKLTLISGTNRPKSNTRKVVGYVENHLRSKLQPSDQIQVLDLCELPPEIFQADVYSAKPASFQPFIDKILHTNGIISVLPEYNGSAPGIFKYFIDMLPFPQSLQKMPCTFVGISDGRFGAVRSAEHMQQVFEYRQAYIFPERVFIPFVGKSIDAEGRPSDDLTRKLLHSQLDNFISFAKKFMS